MLRLFVLLLLLALTGAGAALAQGFYPPRTDRFQSDEAGLLDADTAAAIRALQEQLLSYSVEMPLVTINSYTEYGTGDASLADFARGVFQAWQLDSAPRNLLVLASRADLQVVLVPGSGYSSAEISALQSISDMVIRQPFAAGDFLAALRAGFPALASSSVGLPLPLPVVTAAPAGAQSVPTAIPQPTDAGAAPPPEPPPADSSNSLLFIVVMALLLGAGSILPVLLRRRR
ncbi:MAG: TPM domain-containing protein [Anaerolineae bacterium]|jgi:uncharacterized membrane protein YgcG|nr:TPM domain-containing protein [Anaerolineae bacterium]